MLRRLDYKFSARSFASLKQLNLKERQEVAKVVNQEIALFYEANNLQYLSVFDLAQYVSDVLCENTLKYLDEDQDPVEVQLDEETCELIGHIVVSKYLH